MSGGKDRTRLMEDMSVPQLVGRFFSSTFAALLFSALYNMTDALFVSRGIGDDAMGGVSVIMPFMLIQGAIAQAVGGGAASLVSRLLGQKHPEKAGKVTLTAMTVFYTSAILLTVVGLACTDSILALLGATGKALPYAREYFTVILLGNVFSTGFSSIIRAEGRMTYSLLIWLIPTAVNIVLDAVFILGLNMGACGAATATVLCQFTSFCMSMFFFSRLSAQTFKGVRPGARTAVDIIGIGVPTLVQVGSLSVMTVMLNHTLGRVSGTVGINAFASVSRLVSLGLVPFNALAQAVAPIVGFCCGANRADRARAAVRFALAVSTVYAVAALIVTECVPGLFMRIFTDNPELIAVGSRGLRVIACALPFTALPLLVGTAFQAAGRKLASLILYAAATVFLLPLIVLLPDRFGIDGVWWAFAGANILAVFPTAALAVYSNRKERMRSASASIESH